MQNHHMLSPDDIMLSDNFGWSKEDHPLSHLQISTNNLDITPCASVLCSPSSSQQEKLPAEYFNDEGKVGGGGGGAAAAAGESDRNAMERNRRIRVNCLYSQLRSLLPGADQTEKLSIPGTVSRVVDYIPELQKEVERLVEKKNSLVARMHRRLIGYAQSGDQILEGLIQDPSVAVSINQLNNNKDLVVQICVPKCRKGSSSSVFAHTLEHLENEGLVPLNVSSFETREGIIIYDLHLQWMNGAQVMNVESLRELLLSSQEVR